MLKQFLATAATVALVAGLPGLSAAPAWAEPEPSGSVQPSPGKIVLQQYSYASCGNDWSTRCEIRATADGAYYDIHHGFMETKLVESEKLSDQDWATIRDIVLSAASSAEPAKRRGGFRAGTAISLTAEHNAISLPRNVLDAYEQTKPAQRYRYWSGPGRVQPEPPSR